MKLHTLYFFHLNLTMSHVFILSVKVISVQSCISCVFENIQYSRMYLISKLEHENKNEKNHYVI